MNFPQWFQKYASKPGRSVIGLMSGTSLDGVDAAHVTICGSGDTLQVQLQHFITIPMPPGLRGRILELCRNGKIEDAAVLNVELGELFATVALQLIAESGISVADIDLIGSHGQTICHLPEQHASLQIGEPCIIAERTGITTVADFRPRDLAAGGQGAPLIPYADFYLLGQADQHRIVQNIGGIANCTVLPAGGTLDDVRAWDTGPGNMIMDAAMRLMTKGQQQYDEDGLTAGHGRVNEAWLSELMRHPFFERTPPKSAGREEFGQAFAEQLVMEGGRRGLAQEDILATATALTAASITHSYQAYAEHYLRHCVRTQAEQAQSVEVILGGGGAFNPTLRRMLGERLAGSSAAFSYRLLNHEDVGMRSDAKEAIAFAILAHETMMGTPCNVPGATGANRRVPLGKIVPGRYGE